MTHYKIENGSKWRHVKTDGIYVIVTECKLENDDVAAVAYRSIIEENDIVWVRPKEQFLDGRFERYYK